MTEKETKVVFERPHALLPVVTNYCPGCTHGIVNRLVAECLDELDVEGDAVGVALPVEEACELYIAHAVATVADEGIDLSGLKVALDVGHGASCMTSAEALRRHGFDAVVVATPEEAFTCMKEEIEREAPGLVSFGDSMTMRETGIIEWLRGDERFTLLDGFDASMPRPERLEIRRRALMSDLFITGINAVTTAGTLHWLDMVGNRIAPVAFGPRKVLLVAGRNKLTESREEAEQRIRDIAAEMLADRTELPPDTVRGLFCNETGYQTPKIDTRAAVFRDGKILLVQEKDGLWALPGGWCDVDQSIASNTEKEVREEAGLDVTADLVIAVQDREKHNQPVYAYKICKIFVRCTVIGGAFRENTETVASDYFSLDALPPLAEEKNNREQIAMCFAAQHAEHWKTLLD